MAKKKWKEMSFQEKLEAPDDRPESIELLASIKRNMDKLEALLADATHRWGCEDFVYRFYHQSFKVYGLQGLTLRIVEELKALAPGAPLNEWFVQIVNEGTGKKFKLEDNRNWLEVTRPIVEAFFHALYFLQMAIKYGKELKAAPGVLPSGWASVLYLYNLR